ncbi:MAG: hypothetical protein ABEJ95_07515, partial [Candidatus Nanohalobium sp.]
LYEHGIVDLEDQGRSKKPFFEFEKIEIEPLTSPENMEYRSTRELMERLEKSIEDAEKGNTKSIEELREGN